MTFETVPIDYYAIPFWVDCVFMILLTYAITRITYAFQSKIPAAPLVFVSCMVFYMWGIGNLLLIICTTALSDVVYLLWLECTYRIREKLNKNKTEDSTC